MPAQLDISLLPALVPEQEFLSGFVSTVYGPIEYRQWKRQLERIHELLRLSRVEETFVRLSLAQRNQAEQQAAEKENRLFYKWSPAEQEGYQMLCSQALRCNVARTLTGESLRGFGRRLAESGLLQWFCKLDRLDAVRIPGKSALQRYSQWLPEADMRQLTGTLLAAAAGGPAQAQPAQPLELAEPLDLEAYFLDTTCVPLRIHFPVDWVLLRDAARTLLKAAILIRKRGLKARMEEPGELLKRMNQLCMKMAHARRTKDAKRARKAVLRQMKKLSKIVAGHAERHRDLLDKHWRETDLKEGEARQIIQRIAMVLERLPRAIRQAHERIIGERQVKSSEKLLSLYEDHAAVYVRGKAGAEVEFGSQLLLGEAASGVIVDWELVDGNPLADAKMLRRSLERMKAGSEGAAIGQVCGDRGFDSPAVRKLLEKEKIYNAICPKSVPELRRRMKDAEFAELQQRRSQTEARISIFKNGFLGGPMLSKGRGNQSREVAWSVLAHNLWVIARLPQAKARALAKAG